MARVEFYVQGGGLIVAADDEAAVPRKGEFISIKRETWKVAAVSWAVDQPGGVLKPRLRANVELVKKE